MESTTKKQCVCFAYFGDGKFIGWYADSFGSVRPQSPKIYTNTDRQKSVITRNFRAKMRRISEGAHPNLARLNQGFKLVDALTVRDGDKLATSSVVELRVVECPYYDGENQDFDYDDYERKCAEQRAQMKADGVFDIPAPSRERNEALDSYPNIPCNNWIYADYALVKEWAKIEPTEFIDIITP